MNVKEQVTAIRVRSRLWAVRRAVKDGGPGSYDQIFFLNEEIPHPKMQNATVAVFADNHPSRLPGFPKNKKQLAPQTISGRNRPRFDTLSLGIRLTTRATEPAGENVPQAEEPKRYLAKKSILFEVVHPKPAEYPYALRRLPATEALEVATFANQAAKQRRRRLSPF